MESLFQSQWLLPGFIALGMIPSVLVIWFRISKLNRLKYNGRRTEAMVQEVVIPQNKGGLSGVVIYEFY